MKRAVLLLALTFVSAAIFGLSSISVSAYTPAGYTMQQTRVVQTAAAKTKLENVIADAKAKHATAVCNDLSLTFSSNRRGTCSSHKGVLIWINRPAK